VAGRNEVVEMAPSASAQGEWYQIASFDDLRRVRQEVGLLPPPDEPSKVTKMQREHFVLLAFLLEASLASNLIPRPIRFRKGNPPNEPDFVAECASTPTWFEVTEATDPADKREDAKQSERETLLLGERGGRLGDGTVDPVPLLIGDIVAAIERKKTKAICRATPVTRHLLIYPQSNASFWMGMDERDERRAFGKLRMSLVLKQEQSPITVNGCSVHVLGAHFIAFDVLGRMTFKRKRFVAEAPQASTLTAAQSTPRTGARVIQMP
jgi:hypothetical protein